MAGCCDPSGYGRFFDDKEARRRRRAYERKGLDPMARKLVDHLAGAGIEGSSVIEVGGGVGGLHAELIAAGAVSAVNVELSGGYETQAGRLLETKGIADRVERRIGDFTDLAAGLSADIVVMNRVVCCYPFMERLMGAALASARRHLALTFPRSNPVSRAVSKIGNAYCRMRHVDFQSFIHDPEAIMATAGPAGFELSFHDANLVWHGAVFTFAA